MSAVKTCSGARLLRAIVPRMIIDSILIAGAMSLAFRLRFEGGVPSSMMPVL